jgi:ribonuclease BN (tRNA processing enzyme)
MKMNNRKYYIYGVGIFCLVAFQSATRETKSEDHAAEIIPLRANAGDQSGSGTKVILIGTGTPGITPDRSGPCTAIVVNNTAYLVDMGPGLVRRSKSASLAHGISALEPTNFRVVFVTHLHSDHTVGYPDLIFTPWTMGRKFALEVYGPKGIKSMTDHILKAYRTDIDTRTNEHGNQREFPEGHKVNAHEVTSGVVYKDNNVTVTAFATKHAMESYGYLFETSDRKIVISGDTNPSETTVAACNNCDVLIHEVHTEGWLATRPPMFQQFSAKYHTTVPQLAELANRAKPKLLILYHYNMRSADELFTDMSAKYRRHFVVGRDLDMY